ncbi:SDR family NAD(P)-dependent oxidoreductase [Paracraurococcus ruber]|uniref:3-oxoacyl-ACP reductase n=1 Tax=Paracraurococcus ruber TaxID=77675 RepID=A0ABS1CSM8_9PROT|nr:SDR family NAD(P)-dependent oxidoreductase [Paracraurococcus ruber]MBK1657473.1 3-oxoacyl-ACP reductase [Paracraurococcus ruber]TDG29591.1 SDR family oxidoreductase [Paracraurococcus ruber]
MFRLDGKVAIVTGAGSVGPGWGNGKATATTLARAGASLFCIDVNEAAAAETRDIIAGEGNTAIAHRADMLDSSGVQDAVQACLARFGRIDILVNNVGGSAPGGPADMPEELWDQQIDFNLKTAFLGCKHVLPLMEAQGNGVVVNISSVAGLRMNSGRVHVAYSASKAGIIGFSKSVALGYAKKGIRCNTVVPGLMHTPLVEHRLVRQLGANDAEALIAKRHASVPIGHMGTGWDIAHAVLFLASDEAGFITGTEIVVDGGFTAAGPT